MSVSTIDYIPFDAQRYFSEILPAFEQAFAGEPGTLRELLLSANSIALSLRKKLSLPLAGQESQAFLRYYDDFPGLLDVPTLRSARAGEAWNPWEACLKILPTLAGRTFQTLGTYGELLRSLLLATLCCELPPWSDSWQAHTSGAVIWHDEVIFNWHEYTNRDEQTRELWHMFDLPLPQNMARWEKTTAIVDILTQKHPRVLGYVERKQITGFMTCQETEYLLKRVQVRAEPELDALISECIRDGEGKAWTVELEDLPPDVIRNRVNIEDEIFTYRIRGDKYISHKDLFTYWKQAHPAEIEAFLERYYQTLWMIEAEVLYRMRFAVNRGWGILEAY